MMKDITLLLPDRREITVPFGIKVSSVISKHIDQSWDQSTYDDDPIVGVLANNQLLSLSSPLETHARIEMVRLFSEYGKRIYRHSICFLLAMAASRVFKDRRLIIGHSLGDGYFYSFEDEQEVTDEDIQEISRQMDAIRRAQYPITHRIFSYQDALSFFEENGISDTALLLSYQNDPKITLYECDGFLDLAYEPLLPNTRLADRYELIPYGKNGMLLRYPRQKDFRVLGRFSDNPVLFQVYQEYKQWGKIVHVNCLGQLNRLCDERRVENFIQVAESFQNKQISAIADRIAERRGKVNSVLIAGPSSSGKTTFTKKLGIQLKVLGFETIEISLDNYYLPPEQAPLDENGKPDLEALHALDVARINSDLERLSAGEDVEMISYDFRSHRRIRTGRHIRLKENSLIIMEGIHGLNPELTSRIDRERKFGIYISALTQLNLDDHNRISTTDNRIIRRIVRDHQFRGMSAVRTLSMWDSVHRGEKHNIFPYQNNADTAFNSALDYELAVLKIYAQPLLKSVKPSDSVYTDAQRLLTFLENFYQIPPDLVPDRSILREFIGGSKFSY